VREYGPLVWKTAYRLLPSEADAADCFQETFISAMEASCRSPVRHWAGKSPTPAADAGVAAGGMEQGPGEQPKGHGRNGADAYHGVRRVRVPLAERRLQRRAVAAVLRNRVRRGQGRQSFRTRRWHRHRHRTKPRGSDGVRRLEVGWQN
ncbi:MAG: hypothetical protein NTU53_19210, partial [Planctomycetota bacterium]|nr:hypothetical protein [Planctomycetota bacterium]